eukprot:scaffold29049_cov22-Tisochrysis_lutea.AAC.1
MTCQGVMGNVCDGDLSVHQEGLSITLNCLSGTAMSGFGWKLFAHREGLSITHTYTHARACTRFKALDLKQPCFQALSHKCKLDWHGMDHG